MIVDPRLLQFINSKFELEYQGKSHSSFKVDYTHLFSVMSITVTIHQHIKSDFFSTTGRIKRLDNIKFHELFMQTLYYTRYWNFIISNKLININE